MSERAAIIAGGSAGIGLAVAEALIEDGWSVSIVGRHRERLDAACAQLRARVPETETPGSGSSGADRVLGIAVDLSADDAAARIIAEHTGGVPQIDLLVNNAGVGIVGPLGEKSTKRIDLELNLNLRTPTLLLQAALPALRAAVASNGKARVVNVSSITATETPPNATGYAATKAGLVALSRSANAELSPEGIAVTAILPGLVDTPGADWARDGHGARMIPASDIADAVRFVASTSPRTCVPYLEVTNAGSLGIDWAEYG